MGPYPIQDPTRIGTGTEATLPIIFGIHNPTCTPHNRYLKQHAYPTRASDRSREGGIKLATYLNREKKIVTRNNPHVYVV